MSFKNKMPMTKALLILSYLMLTWTFIGGVSVIFAAPKNLSSYAASLLLIFGGALFAFIVRMLANIGQILFDIKAHFMSVSVETKETIEVLSSDIEKINCDTKELNQNMHQLKTFFSRIEKHLKLEK